MFIHEIEDEQKEKFLKMAAKSRQKARALEV